MSGVLNLEDQTKIIKERSPQALTCNNDRREDRIDLRLDPQVRKVSAACSGLFFEVSSQYNQPSKGVYGSASLRKIFWS